MFPWQQEICTIMFPACWAVALRALHNRQRHLQIKYVWSTDRAFTPTARLLTPGVESKSATAPAIKSQVTTVAVVFVVNPAVQQHASLLTCLFNDAFYDIYQLNTPNILYLQNVCVCMYVCIVCMFVCLFVCLFSIKVKAKVKLFRYTP
jgi:hypothetical protein